MKVSKRSLIVSIAVLCVCALSLTAASFAWFSASQTAKVTSIDLGVAAASDLKISLDAGDWAEKAWSTNITHEAAKTNISDVSTADGETFYVPNETDAAKVADDGTWTGDYVVNTDESAVMELTVYFRSSSAVGVNVAGKLFEVTPTAKAKIASALRMSIPGTIFANTAGTDSCVNGKASDAFADTTNYKIDVAKTILTLEDKGTNDGYFYGQMTFYFYVEGTDENAINDYTGVSFAQDLTFTVAE